VGKGYRGAIIFGLRKAVVLGMFHPQAEGTDMRDLSGATWYRLGELGDPHELSCDRHGAFVGKIPLLERVQGQSGREVWQIRSIPQLNLALSAGYGLAVDFTGKLGGIATIAKALNAGNIALAQIATVQLRLPDLPRLAKDDALGRLEKVTLAVLLSQSGVLEIANQNGRLAGSSVAKRDVSNEPRIPRGQPGAGQWTSGGSTSDRMAPIVPVQEVIIEPLVPGMRPILRPPMIRPAPIAGRFRKRQRWKIHRSAFPTLFRATACRQIPILIALNAKRSGPKQENFALN
jgi:hypothetical protein